MSNLPPLPEPAHRGTDVSGWYSDAFTADQLKAFAEEAVRLEREAILAAIDDLEEPAWYGYENPNNFDDGKRAAMAAIRARSQEGDGAIK